MLKFLYLGFAVALIGGAMYLMTQPKTESGNVAIMMCSIVGILCFVMYFFVDKLKKQ
jgi:quinol-cytochrome oxidoreductase complex cytochrome b subunit